ncbi:MAG: PucR family transcriptional regulator, partial [Actinoallomurus sp.]
VLADADRSWPRLQAAIRRRLGGAPCRLGVGGRYESPADFSRSYHEARLALRLQGAGKDEGRITEFDRLGVYRLFAEIEDQTGVERFVREWLGALLDYDRNRRSELVMTLSRYLECGRRYQATTAALAIHRSTLKYRIQRIREISGHDLGDPDICFNIQLAARAWHTLQALRADHDHG